MKARDKMNQRFSEILRSLGTVPLDEHWQNLLDAIELYIDETIHERWKLRTDVIMKILKENNEPHGDMTRALVKAICDSINLDYEKEFDIE